MNIAYKLLLDEELEMVVGGREQTGEKGINDAYHRPHPISYTQEDDFGHLPRPRLNVLFADDLLPPSRVYYTDKDRGYI